MFIVIDSLIIAIKPVDLVYICVLMPSAHNNCSAELWMDMKSLFVNVNCYHYSLVFSLDGAIIKLPYRNINIF